MLHLPPRVSVIAAKCHVGTSVNKICALERFFSNKSLRSMMILAMMRFMYRQMYRFYGFIDLRLKIYVNTTISVFHNIIAIGNREIRPSSTFAVHDSQ
jgi:hypothetical protein